jgi:hypothetical protein
MLHFFLCCGAVDQHLNIHMCAAAIDPCANVRLAVQLPNFECTDGILPNFQNLVAFGTGLGSLPGQLAQIAQCTVQSAFKQIQDAINSLLTLFDTTFGTILGSVSTPVFSLNLKIPELEMGTRMRALFNEFKLFLELKVLDILSRIIPGLSFLKIPLPFLPDCTIGDLLSSEGRAKIRASIGARVESISAALGLPWNITFSGELGLKNVEMQAQNIISRVWTEFHKNLLSLIQRGFRALRSLTEPIRKIWAALRLPDIPNLVSLNFEAIFNSVWDTVKGLAISVQEKMTRMIDFFLEFDLKAFLDRTFGSLLSFIAWPFPTKVKELLKITQAELGKNLVSVEMTFSTIMGAVKELFEQIPTLILELWMRLVLGFFRAIASLVPVIRELFKYIPFTFCAFIGLAAAPILGLGGAVAALIPAGIAVEPG